MQAFKLSSIFLFTSFIINSCGNHKQEKKQAAPFQVSVYQIEKATRLQTLSYSGTLEPYNTAQIGFAVQGVVNNVAVQEGQFVQQGQLLASIDATEYSNALAIANAGLEQAEDMYSRLSSLYEKGSLPAKDFIDIKTKVAQARANKSINAKHIADSRLYAPMSGIVTVKMIERGSTAAPGVPAFTIIKTDLVYAQFSVPESEVGSLKYDMEATVFIPTLNDSLKGEISIINPQADAVSKTYKVKIRLNNTGQKLLPGMLTEISINTGKTMDAIIIPATSVIRDADNISFVFVANSANKAVKKRVTTGSLTGNNSVIISDGLQTGDKVIIAGQSKLNDGTPVSFK
jgi:RND family efflux transporter MFP subunit